MHALTIYTYGNIDVLYNNLMSMSGIFAGSDLKRMFYLALLISLTTYSLKLLGIVSTGEGSPALDLKYLAQIFLIIQILINTTVPKTILWDAATNQPREINARLPVGLVVIQSLTSNMFYALTMMYQRYFEVDSQDVSYTKSGMSFGSNFVVNLPRIGSGDPIFDKNLTEFYSNCAIPIIYQTGGLNTFMTSTDLLTSINTLFKSSAKVIADARYVQQVTNGHTNIVSCSQAIDNLNSYWNTNSNAITNYVASTAGFSGNVAQFLSSAKQSANDLLDIKSDAEDTLKQSMSMNAIYKSINTGATQVNNTALANASYDAMQFQQYAASGEFSGEQASRVIPAIKAYAEILTYLFYPLVIVFAILAGSFRPVKIYLQVVLTIAALPFMYDVLNSVTYQYAVAHSVSLGGYNLMNAASMYSMNANVVAVSKYLAIGTPMLAYFIITGATNTMISVLGHATDTAKSSANTVAQESSRGNLSMGNVSNDNVNMGNFAANSLSDRLSANTGSAQLNQMMDSGSTLSTTGSGDNFLQQGTSNLRTHESISNAFQQNASTNYHKALSEQSNASNSVRNGLSNLQSTSSGFMSGEDKSQLASISSQVQASANAGVTIDKGLINKISQFALGVGAKGDITGGTSASSQSQTLHGASSRQSNEFKEGLSKTIDSIKDYNTSVNKTQSMATDVAMSQNMGSQTMRNLDTAISRDAIKEFGAEKAERMLEGDTSASRNWITQKVDQYSAERGHLMRPTEAARSNSFNPGKIEDKLKSGGNNLQQVSKNTENQIKMTAQQEKDMYMSGFTQANNLNPKSGAFVNAAKSFSKSELFKAAEPYIPPIDIVQSENKVNKK